MKKLLNKLNFTTAIGVLLIAIMFSSCAHTKEAAYFNDLGDSTLIASKAGLEPVIQKKDILSVSVSSLSPEATLLFNVPNQPSTPGSAATIVGPQTAGYLVSEDGTIKFPILGKIPAAGFTQQQLEDNITKMLTEKKLLFDAIVTVRFLNFRVTVLGEVNHPGVVYAPSEQINILEAIGQAGDLTIFGRRDNIILLRQVGPDKLAKRLDLTSSKILKSPYFFLKSNDIIYVEPGKAKVSANDRTLQLLPLVFSGITILVLLITTILK